MRAVLWDFVRGAVPVLHPGASAPAGVAKLSGLNDGRAAAVKIAMVSVEGAGVCLVLRAGPGEPDPGPGPHRPWRHDLGAPGVRAGAVAVSGIEQVAPEDVAGLFSQAPLVRPWLVVRAALPEATGTLRVDPGDGLLRPVLDFTVLALDGPRPPGERPARCPLCERGRVRRYTTFDLCPDCGWLARGPATRRHPAAG